jgi:hypothetical protein
MHAISGMKYADSQTQPLNQASVLYSSCKVYIKRLLHSESNQR